MLTIVIHCKNREKLYNGISSADIFLFFIISVNVIIYCGYVLEIIYQM